MSNFIDKIPKGLLKSELEYSIISLGCGGHHTEANYFVLNTRLYNIMFSSARLANNFDMMKFIMIMKNLIECESIELNTRINYECDDIFVDYYLTQHEIDDSCYGIVYIWNCEDGTRFVPSPYFRLCRAEYLSDIEVSCEL